MPPSLQNIGILHHKKAKLPKHLQQGVIKKKCLYFFFKLFLEAMAEILRKIRWFFQSVVILFYVDHVTKYQYQDSETNIFNLLF